MNEKINLNPISGKRPVEVTSISRKELNDTGEETKYRHELVLNGRTRNKSMRMIERPDATFLHSSIKVSEKWRVFKEAGLPVVPTIRKTKEGKLFVTDLTVDGSEIYGKNVRAKLQYVLEFPDDVDSKEFLSEIRRIKVFLQILQGEEFEKLIAQVQKYQDLANEKNIGLPTDDAFELILHPDGSWELITLDLMSADVENPDKNFERHNKRAVDLFMQDLQEIKELYKDIERRRQS